MKNKTIKPKNKLGFISLQLKKIDLLFESSLKAVDFGE